MVDNEYFYPGANSYLEYQEPISYGHPASNIGITLDPRTANQLQEVSGKLSTGAKQIEVQGLMPNIFEAIPKQHIQEIKRAAKLAGAELSLHGPLVEASGFDQQSGKMTDINREHAERQMSQAVERAQELDPEGNVVVTFHSTAQLPEMLMREKSKENGEKPHGMYIINPQSGGVQLLKETPRYFPQEKTGKPYEFTPENELEKANRESWEETLNQFAYYAQMEESRSGQIQNIPEIQEAIEKGEITKEQAVEMGFPGQTISSKYSQFYLRNSYNQLKQLFEVAYSSALDNERKKDIETLGKFRQEVINNFDKLEKGDQTALKSIIQKGIDVLGKDSIQNPEMFKPLNEVVIDKSSETFANVALNSYNKFGKNAPIISIENPPAGMGISRAEDLKKLIESSREKFSEKLQKKGYSEKEAHKIAEKTIGATWDVGHINMIRRFGYSDKDVIEESKKIAPFVKHVHLSDNFGFEHTELPMGMGNVPIKDILKQLGKKGEEAKKIIEAGDWFQHFKTMPFPETLEAFGSPLYSMKMAPYWNQVSGMSGNYSTGYGMMLPEQHFSIYGAGLSGLPTELGGQIPGKQSRFAGTPNA